MLGTMGTKKYLTPPPYLLKISKLQVTLGSTVN